MQIPRFSHFWLSEGGGVILGGGGFINMGVFSDRIFQIPPLNDQKRAKKFSAASPRIFS